MCVCVCKCVYKTWHWWTREGQRGQLPRLVLPCSKKCCKSALLDAPIVQKNMIMCPLVCPSSGQNVIMCPLLLQCQHSAIFRTTYSWCPLYFFRPCPSNSLSPPLKHICCNFPGPRSSYMENWIIQIRTLMVWHMSGFCDFSKSDKKSNKPKPAINHDQDILGWTPHKRVSNTGDSLS